MSLFQTIKMFGESLYINVVGDPGRLGALIGAQQHNSSVGACVFIKSLIFLNEVSIILIVKIILCLQFIKAFLYGRSSIDLRSL